MTETQAEAAEAAALELHYEVCTYCVDDVHVYYQDCGIIQKVRTALAAARAQGLREAAARVTQWGLTMFSDDRGVYLEDVDELEATIEALAASTDASADRGAGGNDGK